MWLLLLLFGLLYMLFSQHRLLLLLKISYKNIVSLLVGRRDGIETPDLPIAFLVGVSSDCFRVKEAIRSPIAHITKVQGLQISCLQRVRLHLALLVLFLLQSSFLYANGTLSMHFILLLICSFLILI